MGWMVAGVVSLVVAAVSALLWAVMTTDMGAGPGNEDMMRRRASDGLDFRLGGLH